VFFLTGMLMAFPGAILPTWGHHLDFNFREAGRYFLFMAIGLALAFPLERKALRGLDVRRVLVLGCLVAVVGFLALAMASPPALWLWRAAGVLVTGIAAGFLNAGAFQSLSSMYVRDPAATVNMAGALFGFGCFVMAMFASGSVLVYTPRSTLILLAVVPAFAAGLYARARFADPVAVARKPLADVWDDVRSPGAVLFSLLLFLQFGNEWSVAGWLAVFLAHRIGVSPESALAMLAVYWLALTLGRIAAQSLLTRVRHGLFLFGSALAAMSGALILTATNNRSGAWAGLLLLGLGFAPIYPLVVEKIGHRFPDYHPGFFNGLLSFGIAGGLMVPWAIGAVAGQWGMGSAMVVPFVGTILVLVVILLLWLENRFAR
jgi:FHS family glucose/mannose:H+ symporter-like MFS transporter